MGGKESESRSGYAVDRVNGAAEVVIYSESVGYDAWFYMLMLPLAGLFLALAVGGAWRGEPAVAVFGGAVIVFLVALYAGFRRLRFEITGSTVRFGFPIYTKRIPRERILSCEPYELRFRNYLGCGIRAGLDGTMAYNTRNGPGVKMIVEGEKRPLVVSVNDPGRVCGLLSPVGKKIKR